MALSGNFSGKTTNQYVKPTIYWSAVQDIGGNYSDVTVQLRYSRTNTGYTTQGNFYGALYIDKGLATQQKKSGTNPGFKVTYKSNSLAMEHTFRVYHENDGSKTVTIAATGYMAGTTVESTTIEAAVALDTIPRASSIAAVDANIGTAATVVVTKKNAAYSHSIAYAFGALSGYIQADGSATEEETIFTQSSVAFKLPTDFYGQIPKAKSGKCTLTCKTYYGAEQIGQAQTAEFTATAAESLCVPTVSGTVVDSNETTKALTGDENVLVRYHSAALCAITANARNSATLTAKTVNGSAIGSTLEISNVNTGSFTFTAKDTRGYSKSETVAKTLIPYVKLTVNASVKRTDPTSGKAVLTVKGNYYSGSFGALDNTLALSYQVGTGEAVTLTPALSGNTYTASAALEGLDYDATHAVAVVARDKLETVSANLTVAKGIPTFDWGEKDFQFNVPVTFNAGIEDRNVKTYSSLEQLGLSGGVTTDAMLAAMPEWSMLVFTNSNTNGNYLTDRPTDYCIVVAHKSSVNYGTATATKINSSQKESFLYDWYKGGSHNGWKRTSGSVYVTTAGTSLDDYVDEGWYFFSTSVTAANIPSGSNGWLQVIRTGSVYKQLWYRMGTPGTNDHQTFVRTYASSTGWGAWAQYLTSRDGAMTQLWENATPTGTFDAHSVSIDGADYDAYVVIGHTSINTDVLTLLPGVLCYKGKAGHLIGLPNNKNARRAFSVNSAGTSVTFSATEYCKSTYGTSVEENDYIVPMYIYGMHINT